MRILVDILNDIAAQARFIQGVIAEGDELVSIVTDQSFPGAEPQVADFILEDDPHFILTGNIAGGEMFKRYPGPEVGRDWFGVGSFRGNDRLW